MLLDIPIAREIRAFLLAPHDSFKEFVFGIEPLIVMLPLSVEARAGYPTSCYLTSSGVLA
jgi:hypothetical protein